jgi:hypothetical protein
MTDGNLPGSHGIPFAPHSLVPVPVGRTTVNLYPVIDPSMQVHKRAHPFQINKTTLAPLPVDLQFQLNVLGQQLNLATMVGGIRNDWHCFFHNSWYDFSCLEILSVHNDAGNQINNTKTVSNTTILLTVVNGAVTLCRQPNIKFF